MDNERNLLKPLKINKPEEPHYPIIPGNGSIQRLYEWRRKSGARVCEPHWADDAKAFYKFFIKEGRVEHRKEGPSEDPLYVYVVKTNELVPTDLWL